MSFSLATLKTLLHPDSGPVGSRDSVLGIDIGSAAIKIVQLKDVKGVPTLETYGELQLGPYEGVELGRNTHLSPQKTIEALVDIIREAGATARRSAYALSYSSSFTSIISLPTLDQEQIGTMIPVEARKYIPVSLNKVTLDWVPVGIDTAAKYTNVLLTALYNEAVSQYETEMKGAGLNATAHEVEIFSSIRSIVSPEDEVVAILDWGASATRLYIVERGVLRKTHTILTSGVELTKAISTALTMEFSEAEELKRNTGMEATEGDDRVQKALEDDLRRALREFHTVIKRYGEQEGSPVKKVILSGGGALLRGMPPYITDMFSLPVAIADPFSKVAYPAFLEDTLHEVGPGFSVAIGAALRLFQDA
jgi:type IV pilus assembly protein PilM